MKLHAERLNRIQKEMQKSGFDCTIIGPTANLFYFSGLITSPDERLQLLIIPANGNPVMLIPEMFRAVAESSLDNDIFLHTWSDSDNPFEIANGYIKELKHSRVLVDDCLRSDHLIGLMASLKNSELKPASSLVKNLRLYKNSDEVKSLEKAGKIADIVIEKAMNEIKPGIREKELALFIEVEYKKLADDISFKPIVASGPNAALPHHKPGERKIGAGEFIIIDCGALCEGYCSDITRTFCLGKASDEMKKVYNTVLEANLAAFRALEEMSDITCEKLDSISREVIESTGFGDYFIHRLGHGIGLEGHEDPYLVKGNSKELLPGMVFTIEPGIYIPDDYGVRIEDTVLLTEDGPKSFTSYNKQLVELNA